MPTFDLILLTVGVAIVLFFLAVLLRGQREISKWAARNPGAIVAGGFGRTVWILVSVMLVVVALNVYRAATGATGVSSFIPLLFIAPALTTLSSAVGVGSNTVMRLSRAGAVEEFGFGDVVSVASPSKKAYHTINLRGGEKINFARSSQDANKLLMRLRDATGIAA